MKTDRYRRRFYRDWVNAKDLRLLRIAKSETDIEVLCDKKPDEDFILERINSYRWDIENYISRDRRFLTALKPIAVELSAPRVIQDMAQAADRAGVGPMAAVAGAIAQRLGKDLLKKGYRQVIIENGGDIFLKTKKSRLVGIYTGKSKLWNALKIKIKPKDTPLGICTSSGTVGHSLSFGRADSVVILSKDVALADAVATATANRVRQRQDLQGALMFARGIKGVLGAIIILNNDLISWGKVEFVK
ncbi:MAG: UPF0280 family protein [Candidatus Omnitrophica bacterium]|nr:UPF0280 family protein [Candidatus Omnitrophota bacterium]